MRGIQILVQHPVSHFLFPGMGKIIRCLGSTRYREYLFNSYFPLILCFLLTLTTLVWTLFLTPTPLWTVSCRFVFTLHSFSLGFLSRLAVLRHLPVSSTYMKSVLKCTMLELTLVYDTRIKCFSLGSA